MKLLLVEDNPAMQTTLQRSFERCGMQVSVCGDGARALDRWRAAVPDVVLLDLSLPGLDGLQVLAQARAEGLRTPVLILTARGTVGDRVLGLNTGADDYLAKPFDLDELEARVRALARRSASPRQGALDTAAPAYAGLQVDVDSGAILRDGHPMELTQRETALLRALLQRPGQAVAKERLLELVFPGDAEVQPEAVEVVAYRLRKKLASSPVQLVTLRGLGYLLKAEGLTAIRGSLRRQLLLGILLPVIAVIAVNTVVLYRQALGAADTAYDRTLLATAKSIGELLEVVGEGEVAQVRATVPYSALEAFEADSRSRMYYRVTGFRGESVSGFEDLPAARRELPARSVYAALVHFYDDEYRGDAVRVAVLLQPVAGSDGRGMATVQVAETLELRRTLARQILLDTLWRQAALVSLIAIVVLIVVQRATRPVRELSDAIVARPAGDLTPIDAASAPRELLPLVDATNQVMQRLDRLLAHQKRFVRDASHQLRTPLAVLKTQVQSARRGDVGPEQALAEIAHTVDRATELANQMLALAKVEQLRQQGDAPVTRWDEVARAVALDLAPLVAERGLDFSVDTVPAPVRAHEWALRELVRNLLHNAIKQSPADRPLSLRMVSDGRHVALTVADHGPGIDAHQRERLFQPFSTSPPGADLRGGSGLGLAICHEIVDSLGGTLSLDNRGPNRAGPGPRVEGLDAIVRLPLVAESA